MSAADTPSPAQRAFICTALRALLSPACQVPRFLLQGPAAHALPMDTAVGRRHPRIAARCNQSLLPRPAKLVPRRVVCSFSGLLLRRARGPESFPDRAPAARVPGPEDARAARNCHCVITTAQISGARAMQAPCGDARAQA